MRQCCNPPPPIWSKPIDIALSPASVHPRASNNSQELAEAFRLLPGPSTSIMGGAIRARNRKTGWIPDQNFTHRLNCDHVLCVYTILEDKKNTKTAPKENTTT
ncbi:hypothetical protein RHS04_01270 [Rhizoctonia solani]|uniref:Uncharacterized protein n=1 Tax=Rhizoctonia solani TaxID=456999 RepID=A0A8H7HDJ2_9AGAM|nr:hypothetical protein RHS04_01270 [Rhizoctonia solani]